MVDIVGLNTTTQNAARIADRANARASSSKGKENSSAVAGDRIEISAGAKEAQSIKRLVSAAQAEPDFRPEAVSKAREKVENGELDGIEVSRQTARKILGIS